MMKFRFRLGTLMRQRKIEQDMAQREYAQAQQAVRDQLALIKRMYAEVDQARLQSEELQIRGGACSAELNQLELFIDGQKIRITNARQMARQLMQEEEEKHEILTQKMQAHKVLEKLRDKQKQEFLKQKNKKAIKEIDDITIMRFKPEGGDERV